MELDHGDAPAAAHEPRAHSMELVQDHGVAPAAAHEPRAWQPRTIDDLPWLFRKWLPFHPRRFAIFYSIVQVFSQGITFFAMAQMSGSLAVAGAFAGFLCASNLSFIFTADFSEGIFLEILTNDLENTRKMAKEAASACVFFVIVFGGLLLGVLVWQFVVPFAHSTMLGQHTYAITVSISPLSYACFLLTFCFGGHQLLLPSVPKVWTAKINAYMTRVRDILLTTEADIAESGKSLVELLSAEQKAVERFATLINDNLGVANTLDIALAGLQAVGMVIFIPGGTAATVVICSVVTVLNTIYFVQQLYGLAKPSIVFDRNKRRLLNDAKVQQGKLRMGWTVAMFDSWMERHECNSMRVFGVKVTLDKMRQASGFFASVVTLLMYLLLRDEVRRLVSA